LLSISVELALMSFIGWYMLPWLSWVLLIMFTTILTTWLFHIRNSFNPLVSCGVLTVICRCEQ
jgi:hypothetical protein